MATLFGKEIWLFNSLAVTHCLSGERNSSGRGREKTTRCRELECVMSFCLSDKIGCISEMFAHLGRKTFNKPPPDTSVLDSGSLQAVLVVPMSQCRSRHRVLLARPCGIYVGACMGVFLPRYFIPEPVTPMFCLLSCRPLDAANVATKVLKLIFFQHCSTKMESVYLFFCNFSANI